MKDQIKQALRVLVGLPLWDAGRTADLLWFQFGPSHTVIDRRGRTKLVGAYAVHVQCAWRLIGPTQIVVACRDRC